MSVGWRSRGSRVRSSEVRLSEGLIFRLFGGLAGRISIVQGSGGSKVRRSEGSWVRTVGRSDGEIFEGSSVSGLGLRVSGGSRGR